MRKIIWIAAALMIATYTAPGFAQVKAGSFNITPNAGIYVFEGNEDMKNAPTLGVRAGYFFTKYFGAEIYGQWIPTEVGENVIENGFLIDKMNRSMFNYGLKRSLISCLAAAGTGLVPLLPPVLPVAVFPPLWIQRKTRKIKSPSPMEAVLVFPVGKLGGARRCPSRHPFQ